MGTAHLLVIVQVECDIGGSQSTLRLAGPLSEGDCALREG